MTGRICFYLSLVSLVLFGCGSPALQTSGSSDQSTISLSPASARAGSDGFDVTITGNGFVGEGFCGSCTNSVVVWTTDSGTDRPSTTFVSSTELKAFVTPDLLAVATSAKVSVETWAASADAPTWVSRPAVFSVTERPPGAPIIAAISPNNTRSGSADLTLTITGSNFENYKSVAFWTTDPNNLHDHGTMLNTTFVSTTQITAVIPATLLANSVCVQIVVLTGDPMGMSDGFFAYPESNAVTFTVTE